MNKLNPLKFGIIGCSRIAKKSVIPAILKSEFAELEIIGSRTNEKSKELAKKFNCKKNGNYDDVISDESVDAIYISTPIGTHAELAIKAASAGKHIYCEKSSTDSFNSAKKMIEFSKNNNVRIMEGFMFRFHPQHQKVKELIDIKKIGKVDSFNGSFGFPSFPEGDIRYNKELGGGFLNDSGCYPICASRMIFDEEPLSVFYHKYNHPKMGVDIKGTSILIYKNNKKIGNIDSFNGSFGFPSFPEGDIRYNKELGGGFLNDSGCYPICASRMIFDEEPLSVFYHNSIDSKTGVDIKGTSILTYKNNKTANITYVNGNYYQAKYEVWGSQGIISLDRAYSVPSDFTTKINLQYNIENTWEGRKNEIIKVKPADHFLKMIDIFCMEIAGKKKSPFNFEEELLNQAKVMTAHRLSNSNHKEIWLSEII